MKSSFLTLSLAFFAISLSAHALEKCPVDFGQDDYLEKVADLATNASSCYEASEIVDACALGASGDVYTVGAAIDRCQKDFPVMTPEYQQNFSFLNNKCTEKYESMEGTLYLSMNAFCHLSVSKLFNELLSPVE